MCTLRTETGHSLPDELKPVWKQGIQYWVSLRSFLLGTECDLWQLLGTASLVSHAERPLANSASGNQGAKQENQLGTVFPVVKLALVSCGMTCFVDSSLQHNTGAFLSNLQTWTHVLYCALSGFPSHQTNIHRKSVLLTKCTGSRTYEPNSNYGPRTDNVHNCSTLLLALNLQSVSCTNWRNSLCFTSFAPF